MCNINILTKTAQSIKKTNYGFLIKEVSSYVAIYTTRVYVLENGFQKAVTREERNYYPPRQYTTYYSPNGFQMDKTDWNSKQKES